MHLSAQLSGGDHSSLDFRHRPVQPGDSSSAAPREPHTLHVLPIRTHLDEVKLLKRGDVYLGRGCRERSLKPSQVGGAIWTFMMSRSPHAGVRGGPQYKHRVHEFTEKRLLCHCRSKEQCHGDNLIQLHRLVYPNAYDRTDTTGPPTFAELNALAEGRNDRSDSE